MVKTIETALSSGVDTKNTEIAFFGGSFTAIDRSYMMELLNSAKPYIHKFNGIRCSTRPDCINEEILNILKSFGVTSIELGAQSMCDDVLKINNRGHLSKDVEKASKLIKEKGFSLGLQMMTGLYGSSPYKDMYTAKKIADLSPDTVRIYPTITLENTPLADLFREGKYIPYDEKTTIKCCADILEFFYKRNINVIRVGLHYSDELMKTRVAGFYHPSFREICESLIFYRILLSDILKYKKGKYNIYVGERFISKAIGNKRINIENLKKLGYSVKFLSGENIEDYGYIIEEKK